MSCEWVYLRRVFCLFLKVGLIGKGWLRYCLTMGPPLALYIVWRKKRHDHLVRVWVPMLVFACFSLLLVLLMPLPRYMLPLRPVSYVLGM